MHGLPHVKQKTFHVTEKRRISDFKAYFKYLKTVKFKALIKLWKVVGEFDVTCTNLHSFVSLVNRKHRLGVWSKLSGNQQGLFRGQERVLILIGHQFPKRKEESEDV